MAAVLLDTTALIDALRGRDAADRIRQLRAAGDRPYVCAVNVEELFRGLLPADKAAATRLLNGLRILGTGGDPQPG
jgi:predicted nucleic acid-binding protein